MHEQPVESLEKRLQRARSSIRGSGTGDYNYDVEAGVGLFDARETCSHIKERTYSGER